MKKGMNFIMTETLDEYFMRAYEGALKQLDKSEQFIKDYPNAMIW